VAVECQANTGLEDPPTTLAELVWTGDDGWVWHVQPEGELGSLDYSSHGRYVVFTTNSQYGRAHHVTSYHADLGWRDLTRRELGSTGDDLVAAINDAGSVVALRGAGFEDEPGYWFGGRLLVESYDATTGTWRQRFSRRYPDGGVDPAGIDLAAGRIVATLVRSRSTASSTVSRTRSCCCPADRAARGSGRRLAGVARSSPHPWRSRGPGSASLPGRRSTIGAMPDRGSRRGPRSATSRRCTTWSGGPTSPTPQRPAEPWTCRSAPTARAPSPTSGTGPVPTTRRSAARRSASGATVASGGRST